METTESSLPIESNWLDVSVRKMSRTVGGIIGNVPLLAVTLLDLGTGGGWKRQPFSPGLRSIFPKGQTGAYHALGCSGKYSLTGGQKFKNMAKKLHLDVPTGNDQLFVNPPVDVWQKLLNNNLTFDINDLGDSPPPVSPKIVQVMPTKDQFYNATKVNVFHTRNPHLKRMDNLLVDYSKLSDFDSRSKILVAFYWEGVEYLRTSTDPMSIKQKVKGYCSLAVDLSA